MIAKKYGACPTKVSREQKMAKDSLTVFEYWNP